MHTKKFSTYSKMLTLFILMILLSPNLLAQEDRKHPEKPEPVTCYFIDGDPSDSRFELDTVTLDVKKCRKARACCPKPIPGGMQSKEVFRFVDQGRIYEVLGGQIKFVGNTSQ